MKFAKRISMLLGAVAAALANVPAVAQTAAAYPNKPARIINPFPAGGASDLLARLLSEKFTKELGQSFVVDNRAGGDGIIGAGAVAKAAPDGYTIMVTTDSFLINPWLHTSLPYDSVKDFTLISPLARSESVLAIHAAVPANNLRDFIAYAKANPGLLNVGSASPLGDMKNQWFMNVTGIKMTNVNYKGGAPAMVDLLAGTVQAVIFSGSNVGPSIKVGKLKGLAISGDKRDPGLPDVPTFAEAGVKEFDPAGPLQFPFLAPSKTPRDIVEKLNAQVRKVQTDPEVVASLAKQGFTPVTMPVSQAEKLLPAELERYGKMFKDAGLKPEN